MDRDSYMTRKQIQEKLDQYRRGYRLAKGHTGSEVGLQGRTKKEWIEFYEKKISHYENLLREKTPKKTHVAKGVVAMALLLTFGILLMQTGIVNITGFATYDTTPTFVTILDDVFPGIVFVDPTPDDLEIVTVNDIYVNATVSDDSSQLYAFTNWNNSLVGWWRMDNDSSVGENNTLVYDWSGQGNNGTAVDNAAPISSGKFGGGFESDGDGDYIELGANEITNFNNSFTISGWFKTEVKEDNNYLFMQGTTSNGIRIYTQSGADLKIHFRLTNGTSDTNQVYSTVTNLDDGNWHFFAATYNESNEMAIYIDDETPETGPGVTGADLSVNHNHIGRYGNLDQSAWNGTIDEFMIFNRSLSALEIEALYNASAPFFENNYTELEEGPHTFQSHLIDGGGNLNSTEIRTVTYEIPQELGIELIYPTEDINVSQYRFFNYTVNVTCLTGTCGEVNVSLTETKEISIFYDNFSEASEIELESHTPDEGVDWSRIISIGGGQMSAGLRGNDIASQYAGGSSDGALYVANISGGYPSDYSIGGYFESLDRSGEDAVILAVRVQNEDNMYAVRLTGDTDDTQFYIKYGGAWTALGSPMNIGTRVFVKLKIEGSTLSLWNNTHMIGSVEDPNITAPGKAGMGLGAIILSGDDMSNRGPEIENITINSINNPLPVSTDNSETPFYTNISTNPYSISLSKGESQTFNFWINATEENIPQTHDLFVYTNKTSNQTISNQTLSYDNTIYNLLELEVELISPEDNVATRESTNYFKANFTSNPFNTLELKNTTIYVWNSTGIYNTTTLSISGSTNSSNLSVNLDQAGPYSWNYYLCDEENNCALSSSNYSIYRCGDGTSLLQGTHINCSDASWHGEDAGDHAGNSISYAGDVNGDGYDDLIIGARVSEYAGSTSGQTYLIYGSEEGLSMHTNLSNANASWHGEDAGDQFGESVSYAGDVNGDGYDDLIIGASNDEYGGGTSTGQTYLIYGSEEGFAMRTNANTANASFYGEDEGDYAGEEVTYAGDVNGDGYDDIIIGTYDDEYGGVDAGQAYLIYGSETGLEMRTNLSEANASWYGEAVGDRSARKISFAGDMNDDGYDDIIIGAQSNDYGGVDAGQAYLIYGSEEGFAMRTNLSEVNASFYGEDAGSQAGLGISYVGDVNLDGYDDIIIGAQSNEYGGSQRGQVYAIYGSEEGFAMRTNLSEANASWYNSILTQFLGISVGGIGDVNGDGYDDMAITGQEGTYIVYGPASNPAMRTNLSEANASFHPATIEASFGLDLSYAGDVNGDGYDDIIIDHWTNDYAGTFTGQTYLIYGTGEDFQAKTITSINITNESDYTGSDNGGTVLKSINGPLYVNVTATGGSASVIDVVTLFINSSNSSRAIQVKAIETGVNTNEYHARFKVRTAASNKLSKKVRVHDKWQVFVQARDDLDFTENVTVKYAEAPTIAVNYSIGPTDPTVSSTTDITFYFNVTDTNGVEDINSSSVVGSFNYSGETTKTNNSCVWIANYTSVNIGEFQCTITMQHYDVAGNWTINASVWDNDGLFAENTSHSWKYNLLYSLDFSDTSVGVNWSTISGSSTNVEADDNPYTITNEGNADNISINITAYDLVGVDVATKIVPAENFSVDITSDGCSGDSLTNATDTKISGARIHRYNGTTNIDEETLYFCLKGVAPEITSQEYTSTAYDAWTIDTFWVTILGLVENIFV